MRTGTTSLCKMAQAAGLKSCHEWDWHKNPKKIEQYDFLCDGGGHFIGCEHTLNYKKLDNEYVNKLFILNIRDVKSWVISKCKHMGWEVDTVIEPDKECTWRDYKEKNLLNVKRFIDFYYFYYISSVNYLIKHRRDALRVDIVNKVNVKHFKEVIGLKSRKNFWSNKSLNKELPDELKLFITKEIRKHHVSEEKLRRLLRTMDVACKVKPYTE